MKKVTLCATFILFLAAVWCLQPIGTALAGDLTLTFASTTPPKSNLEIASEKFVEMIAQKTGNRVKIKHYGAGSLYNAKSIMPAISNGQVDIGILHVGDCALWTGFRTGEYLYRPIHSNRGRNYPGTV